MCFPFWTVELKCTLWFAYTARLALIVLILSMHEYKIMDPGMGVGDFPHALSG